MLKFICSHCRSRLKAPEEQAGTTLRCPKCHTSVTVPQRQTVLETALMDEDPSPDGAGTRQLIRKPITLRRWAWFLAFGVGLLLAFPCEIVLLNTFAEGNHQLGHEIDRAHGYHGYRELPSYSDELARAKRDYPHLSQEEQIQIANQRSREAQDREQKAGEESLHEYSMLFQMRMTKMVVIGLLIATACFLLSFGTLVWLKRAGRVV